MLRGVRAAASGEELPASCIFHGSATPAIPIAALLTLQQMPRPPQ